LARLVNLNDAVYRMCHPQMQGFDVYTMDIDFNATNCPLLQGRSSKEVVSFCDWVKILGGDPAVAPNWTRSCGRARANENANYIHTNWGRTFGTYKGSKGKPLAECMSLNEMFWYWDRPECRGWWSTAYGDPNDAASPAPRRVGTQGAAPNVNMYNWDDDGFGYTLYRQYHNNGWQGYVNKTPLTDAQLRAGSNYFTLSPGVYMLGLFPYYNPSTTSPAPHYARVCSYIDGELIADGGLKATGWTASNLIFFVDSPVQFKQAWHDGASYYIMMFSLYRLTPDGYWG